MTVFCRRLPRFEYALPREVDEAVELLARRGPDAVPMAGGTDLLPGLRRRSRPLPSVVVDIKALRGLDGIAFEPAAGLSIGALATIRDVINSGFIRDRFPSLLEAASSMASPQVRNRGTLAGNLCSAVPSADSAPPLLSLRAAAVLRGTEGERTVPLERFFAGPGQTVLRPGEIVTRLTVPRPAARSCYLKLSTRHSMDLAIVGVAAAADFSSDGTADVRIALGAVAPTPMRALAAEGVLRGHAFSEDLVEEAAQAAGDECRPLDDHRASARYRRDMVRVLVRRALGRVLA